MNSHHTTNRGLVLSGDWNLHVADHSIRTPQPGEAIVKVVVSGVCGSDLHMAAYSVEDNQRWRVDGIFGGHEAAGEVLLAPSQSGLSTGDRVLVYHYEACWDCEACRAGFLQWCPRRRAMSMDRDGSFATHLIIDARNCIPLPDDFSYEDGASIACTAGTSAAAVFKLRDRSPGSAVVVGLGAVGLGIAQILTASGTRVVGVDLRANRRDFAKTKGLAAEVRQTVPTEPLFPVVFEATGSVDGRRSAIRATTNGGEVILVGMWAEEATFPAEELLDREITIRGSNIWPITLFEDIVRLYRDLDIRPESLRAPLAPSEPYDLLRGRDAVLAARSAGGKVYIYPNSIADDASGES